MIPILRGFVLSRMRRLIAFLLPMGNWPLASRLCLAFWFVLPVHSVCCTCNVAIFLKLSGAGAALCNTRRFTDHSVPALASWLF